MLDFPYDGMKELNRIVDDAVLDKHATPSPLLKFYNQLASTMGVDFVNREILTID